jgi:hypothetical protein
VVKALEGEGSQDGGFHPRAEARANCRIQPDRTTATGFWCRSRFAREAARGQDTLILIRIGRTYDRSPDIFSPTRTGGVSGANSYSTSATLP